MLNGVSCVSSASCEAVGEASGSSINGTLAEHWDGSAWTVQATPTSGSDGDALNSVSCVSATRCTAVGEATDATLAETWNGTDWRIQPTPIPNDVGTENGLPPTVVLSDVACPSSTSCMAVGAYRDSFDFVVTLAERWNGSTWTIERTLNPQPALIGGFVSEDEANGGGSFCWVCFGEALARVFIGFPVDSADGNMYDTSSDISIPGRSTPLAFSRTYNFDMAGVVGPLGFGWVSNLTASLAISPSTVVLTEEDGAQTTFTLANGAWTAPPRDIATLTHNGDGTWTLVRQAQQTLTFDSSGRLTSMSDRNGYTTTYGYTGNFLTSVTDSSGRQLVLGYTGGLLTSVTDPNVSPARVVRYEYNDGNGDLTDVIDVNGGDTHYVYDASHRMTGMIDPKCYATSGCPGIQTQYDAAGQVDAQSDQLGRTTTFAYSGDPSSGEGGTTTITDPKGNVTFETYQYGVRVAETRGYGTPQAATWTYQYDPATAQPTLITDPDGITTSMTYDSSGNMLTRSDALGRETTWTYNSLNEPLTVTDPLIVASTNTYDARGNLLTTSRPLTGTGQTQTTSYAYDDATHPGDVTSMTDADGKISTYTYDTYGDRTTATNPLGNKRTSTYSADGWLLSSTSPRGNTSGADPAQYTTSYTYDRFGQVLTTTDPLGHITTNTYDADQNLTSVTDADGNKTTYTYDAADQPTATLRADGTTLRTTYWPDGAIENEVDGTGHVTHYEYDALGRASSVTDPLGRTTSYGYDAAGNETTITDPQQRVTTMTYDADNEPTSVSYSDGATPDVTDITYDADGQRTGQTDGSGTWSWTWDSLHRLTRVTEGTSGTVRYQYDLRNQPTQIAYPGGQTVSRRYDDAGQWTSVSDWLGNTTTFGYDPNGNLTTETLPASTGMVDTSAYAADDSLSSIAATRGPTTIFSANYTRDPDRQLTGDSSAPASSQSIGYTPLNQLCYTAAATGSCASPPSGATSYRYDSSDNLTQHGDTSQSFDAGDELTSASGPPVPPGPSPPVNTLPPQITGTPQEGQALLATPGTWSGTQPISYSYRWSDGAAGLTNILGPSDLGHRVSVTVTATNSAGSATATSASVGPVTTPSPKRLPRITSGKVRFAHIRRVSATDPVISQFVTIRSAGDRVLAFIATSTPHRGRERVAGVNGTGGRWSPVTTVASRAGLLAIWQARAPRPLKHARIVVTLRRGGVQVSLAVVAFDSLAVVVTHSTASARSASPHVTLPTPAASVVMAIGTAATHSASVRPADGQRLLARAFAAGSSSWLQTTTAIAAGHVVAGASLRRSSVWALSAIALSLNPPNGGVV